MQVTRSEITLKLIRNSVSGDSARELSRGKLTHFEGTISSLGIAAPILVSCAEPALKNPFLHPILAARGLRTGRLERQGV